MATEYWQWKKVYAPARVCNSPKSILRATYARVPVDTFPGIGKIGTSHSVVHNAGERLGEVCKILILLTKVQVIGERIRFTSEIGVHDLI